MCLLSIKRGLHCALDNYYLHLAFFWLKLQTQLFPQRSEQARQ